MNHANRLSARLAIAALLSLVLTGMSSTPKTEELSGTVSFRERMALPPTAVVQVQLADVSRADAPAIVLAETSIGGGPNPPIPFTLTYEPGRIQPGMTYALQARITDGDTLMFINTDRIAFTGSGQKYDILVQRVAGKTPEAAASPVGAWLATEIGGKPVAEKIESTLDIAADGQVSGNGGCNGFGGTAAIEGEKLSFGQMRSTMMACEEPAVSQEYALHQAFGKTKKFRLDSGRLVLLDEAGDALAIFAKR